MKIKKFTPFEVKRRLRKLKKLANSNESIELQLETIKYLSHGLLIRCNTIQNDWLYRSRWNEDGYLFSHVDELKYKQADLVEEKGRLNDIGESMLYAAACELGTILESTPKTQTLFTICKIQCQNKELLYIPIESGGREDPARKSSSFFIYEYFVNQMQKEVTKQEDYNATIAIGRFFSGTKLFGRVPDGEHFCISYPSVESSKTADIKTFNVAIPPDVFDKHFKIVEAKVYVLTDESGSYMLNELNRTSGIDDNGDIRWHHSLDEMAIRALHGQRFDDSINENIKGMVELAPAQIST